MCTISYSHGGRVFSGRKYGGSWVPGSDSSASCALVPSCPFVPYCGCSPPHTAGGQRHQKPSTSPGRRIDFREKIILQSYYIKARLPGVRRHWVHSWKSDTACGWVTPFLFLFSYEVFCWGKLICARGQSFQKGILICVLLWWPVWTVLILNHDRFFLQLTTAYWLIDYWLSVWQFHFTIFA